MRGTRIWGVKLALFIVVLATIGCDQVSKHVASIHLMDRPRQSYLGDSVRLEYAENPGAFLGLGAELPRWARTALLSACTAVLLLAYIWWAFQQRCRRIALLGLALILAGGLSNLLDRLLYGNVVDFLNVGVGSLRTGIFNVADMAILLGAVLVVGGHLTVRTGDEDTSG